VFLSATLIGFGISLVSSLLICSLNIRNRSTGFFHSFLITSLVVYHKVQALPSSGKNVLLNHKYFLIYL